VQVTALVHVHTTASDGSASPEEIARAAAAAGVEVVVLTDHDRLSAGPRWRHGALLVAGQEVSPRHNHLLVLGLDHALPKQRGDGVSGDPAKSLELARRRGGWSALAHPLDPALPLSRGSRSFPWLDFSALDSDGLELWNAMSAFKQGAARPALAMARIFFPRSFLAPPDRLTLALWDTVGRSRRWVAVGGGDAHGFTTGRRWLPVRIYSYRLHMRLILTGLWLSEPFSGDAGRDQALVLEALAAGRAFASLGPARGLVCRLAGVEGLAALPGTELAWRPGLAAEVELPFPGRARLLRNGRVAARGRGRRFRWPLERPGVWRVEARRLRLSGWRPWVYCNPFYLREPA
jgi:hypothetical protein